MISRLLVICRGEIAVRVIRAAKDLGITAIAAHSDADTRSLAVQLADEAVNIGGAHAQKSYLNQDAILEAARAVGADAVHPGYGFLSENAQFAKRVAKSGLVWVGPDAITIARMGDKASAIETALAAGVPVVPGSNGLVDGPDAAAAAAEEVGYPVLIKASAGGGGRGIRAAANPEELQEGVIAAQQEALAAFGDSGVYLERLVARARHIEVQVLGDGHDAVHFFERDCSMQRRRQKIWEEAPAAVLSEETRADMCNAAVALARSVNYSGAGTVEFLYDEDTSEYYFIEMNTRIQVEHPISEQLCGVDLVAAMLRIAGGERLGVPQEAITRRGHAIEVRLNAEDPENNFMPSPGTVDDVSWPLGPGIRIDSMIYPGYAIPPFYDSLIGKLIVHGSDRDEALEYLARALSELTITGIKTTAPLFARLVQTPEVRKNQIHTTWIESWMGNS